MVYIIGSQPQRGFDDDISSRHGYSAYYLNRSCQMPCRVLKEQTENKGAPLLISGTALQVITDFTCPRLRGGSVNSRSEDSCLAVATKLAKLMKNWKCKIISTKCKINLLREQRGHQHHYMVAKHGHRVSKTG